MSEKRETILRLTQDATGRIIDAKIEQAEAPAPAKPLTVIELKPETMYTYLRDLTEGSVVDWGDGTKSVVTAGDALAQKVYHAYDDTSTANRVVTIDGVIDRGALVGESSFDYNRMVAVRSLGELKGEANYLFYNCSRLTAIPQGLFDHYTAVTGFNGCFRNCTSLPSIPAGLFAHCTAADSFDRCFDGCSSLTGETPYTMVDGKKIKLWERSPKNGFPKACGYIRCFAGCTGLSDYAEIPLLWK